MGLGVFLRPIRRAIDLMCASVEPSQLRADVVGVIFGEVIAKYFCELRSSAIIDGRVLSAFAGEHDRPRSRR